MVFFQFQMGYLKRYINSVDSDSNKLLKSFGNAMIISQLNFFGSGSHHEEQYQQWHSDDEEPLNSISRSCCEDL